jgi:putative transposase
LLPPARAGRCILGSQRCACVLIGVDPNAGRREHPPDNPGIRLEMNKTAEKRRRFGYRRIGVMLERVGMVMNEKKLTGSTGKKGCRCAATVAANGRAAGHTARPVPLRPNPALPISADAASF